MKQIINIKGMSCAHCAGRAEKALTEIEGVTSVEVSLDTNTATIQSESGIRQGALVQAVEDAGYEVVTT